MYVVYAFPIKFFTWRETYNILDNQHNNEILGKNIFLVEIMLRNRRAVIVSTHVCNIKLI